MDILKELLTILSPKLKKIGFTKKGNSFYLFFEKNHGVINFQKSRDSSKEEILFTLNFGVYSYVLNQFLSFDKENIDKPDLDNFHWYSRIGAFISGNSDHWWKVKISDNLNLIASNVLRIIENNLMPELNLRLNDEGLINCWLTESKAGTSAFGRFRNLTILLKEKEDFNTLNQVIDSFLKERMANTYIVLEQEHIKKLGLELPIK